MPDNDGISQHIDLLAAVVLHVLVAESARTFEPICRSVQRDPNEPDERAEVDAALAVLVDDGLALREGEQWMPTRAAVRAEELSF
jgi:hypothetical protein